MGRVLLVSMVSLSLALTGCASLAGGAPTPTTALGKPCPFANTVPDPNATPTMLQAVRPYNLILNLPAFSRCIADTARVQRLYTAALALPPKAPGVYACPKSWGYYL